MPGYSPYTGGKVYEFDNLPHLNDNGDVRESFPPRARMLYNETGATITAGTIVMYDSAHSTYGLGASIKKCTSQSAIPIVSQVYGVALEDIPDKTFGPVGRDGVVKLVKADAAVLAGGAVEMSTAVDGNVMAYAAGARLGLALTATSSGTCTVLFFAAWGQ